MTPDPEADLEEHIGETFAGIDVSLDGKWFKGCTFIRCRLIFIGVKTFGWAKDCSFDDCQFSLDGIAEMVVAMIDRAAGEDALIALATLIHHSAPPTVSFSSTGGPPPSTH